MNMFPPHASCNTCIAVILGGDPERGQPCSQHCSFTTAVCESLCVRWHAKSYTMKHNRLRLHQDRGWGTSCFIEKDHGLVVTSANLK